MRLTKIKLAGFKSFVDPTTIGLPSALVGVVGPNGCGKSNVIDAVRWVMGESSAKHLRGDSMEDVIFNGSTSRKPIGQASVELVFDNADGSLGGEYARFSEISIRRLVSRDGQSQYFLNNARCRRRDITDIFLGTGLGPRSYAIIEQGMISRLIDAKPEELRVYIEEAAGISKYKERRRETENRIKHTRENLDRLNDLREEIEKQLNHLQRQARTAERFKDLKAQERRAKGELIVLRLGALDADVEGRERELREQENRLEGVTADLRSTEAAIEKEREALSEANEAFNEVQGRYYKLGADITRAEQSIQHNREMRLRQERELEQAEGSLTEASRQIEEDRSRLRTLAESIAELTPRLQAGRAEEASAGDRLREAEQAMRDWQTRFEEFNRRAAEPSEIAQVERTRMEHLERQIHHNDQRLEQHASEQRAISDEALRVELGTLNEQAREAEQLTEREQARLQETLGTIEQARERVRTLGDELDELRGRSQD
ncbi:MAG: AAA family ATPase, partial [Chromatiales bacterium]